MSYGIDYIKLDGVDISGLLNKTTITETDNGSTCVMEMVIGVSDTYTWSPYNAEVIVKSLNGDLIFYGHVFTDDEKFNQQESEKTIIITAYDTIMNAKHQQVRARFIDGTLCKQAIQSLLTDAYPSHILGTVDVDLEKEDCPLEFNGETFQDAMFSIMGLIEKDLYWSVDYDEITGDLTHNFQEKYTTSVGTFTEIRNGSTPFTEDKRTIVNAITMSSNKIEARENHPQFFPFEGNVDYSLDLSGSQDITNIPIEFEPTGKIRLFLIIGKKDTPSSVLNASRYEFNVDPLDPNNPFYDSDIRRYLQSIDATYTSDFLIGGSQAATQALTGSDVAKAIIGKYTANFRAVHNPNSEPLIPSSTYGYLACKSKIYLVNNIKTLEKEIGQSIDPDDILGYELYYPFQITYTKYFEDQTSINTYGKHYVNIGLKQFATIKAFELYGRAYISANKTPKKSGVFTVRYYDGTSFNLLPKLGHECIVNCGFAPWDSTDVQITSITHTIEKKRWLCKVSSKVNPRTSFWNKFMNSLLRRETSGENSINIDLEVTETLTLADGTVTRTELTESDLTYDQTDLEYLMYV